MLATFDTAVRLWSPPDYDSSVYFSIPLTQVHSLSFHSSGAYIFATGSSPYLFVYDIANHTIQKATSGENSIKCAVSSPDGKSVAIAGNSGKIIQYKCETLTKDYSYNVHKMRITSLMYCHNNKEIISGDSIGHVNITNKDGTNPLPNFEVRSGGINDIQMSYYSRACAVSTNSNIILYDLNQRKIISEIDIQDPRWIRYTTSNQNNMVVASSDGTVCVYDIRTNAMTKARYPKNITSFDLKYDGYTLAASLQDQGTIISDVRWLDNMVTISNSETKTVAFQPSESYQIQQNLSISSSKGSLLSSSKATMTRSSSASLSGIDESDGRSSSLESEYYSHSKFSFKNSFETTPIKATVSSPISPISPAKQGRKSELISQCALFAPKSPIPTKVLTDPQTKTPGRFSFQESPKNSSRKLKREQNRSDQDSVLQVLKDIQGTIDQLRNDVNSRIDQFDQRISALEQDVKILKKTK